MKFKTLLLSASTLLLAAAISSFTNLYPSGSPGGYTGSPTDGHNCTACHGGTASTVDSYITTDIPIDGYIAGTTYNITVSYSSGGKKGFELTCEDANHGKVGQLHTGSGTKLTNANHAITHNQKVSSSPAIWNFTWTAPEMGTGPITFYAALAINESQTKLCSLPINEKDISGVEAISAENVQLYPNPAMDVLHLKTINNDKKTANIYSLDGKLMARYSLNKEGQLDISTLQPNVYMIMLEDHGHQVIKKFLKE